MKSPRFPTQLGLLAVLSYSLLHPFDAATFESTTLLTGFQNEDMFRSSAVVWLEGDAHPFQRLTEGARLFHKQALEHAQAALSTNGAQGNG